MIVPTQSYMWPHTHVNIPWADNRVVDAQTTYKLWQALGPHIVLVYVTSGYLTSFIYWIGDTLIIRPVV